SPPVPVARGGSPLAWVVALALAAMVGALLFVAGYLAAGGRGTATCAAPAEAFEAFCDAYQKIKDQYVDRLDDEALAEGAIRGMFEYGVQDPFSGYMPPEEYRRALGDLSGEFSGIGAEMGVRNLEDPDDLGACTTFSEVCVLVVVAPLEDSPAERAGLRAGDIVLAVDGETVEGIDLSEAVQRIRGKAGTDVTLTLRRGDETFDLTITRDEIQLREVTSRMLEDGVGYIALHGFSEPAAQQFREALRELLDAGATSIVFDLRDNPGGFIDAARQIASEFVREGVLFTQESSGGEVRTWEATGDGLATDEEIDLVVLVNGGSASASEIVAAALKERGRGTIVGQPTYGKNTVQVWNELENGGGVRITISRWFTPDHNSVAPDGIQPDVAVEVPDGTPPERDLFLETALDVLRRQQASAGDQPTATPAPSAAREAPSGWLLQLEPIGWDLRGLARARA
ncbi:MAG TPA: S41 family peptidase, partial [candidate division Zixibacteria bacterium]|nr:S41 family peptidase [candidate division Zixibacteria bacterium]